MTFNNQIKKVMTLVYYFCIFLIVIYSILPYTRFYYYKPIFSPFAYRLNKSELILTPGESGQLYILGIYRKIHFSSSDFKVAEVFFTGKVTAHRCGKTLITAEVNGQKKKCMVYVVDLKDSNITINVGEMKQIEVVGIKEKPVYKSLNCEIASIDETGMVHGISKGSCKASVIIKGKTLTCKITVK